MQDTKKAKALVMEKGRDVPAPWLSELHIPATAPQVSDHATIHA
jgi:hypothetical protein